MPRRGFTLIELLIFVAIFSVAIVGFTAMLIAVVRVQSREVSATEVEEQGQFLLQQVEYYVASARLVDMTADTATGTLQLRETVASSSLDPTIISVASGTVYLQQGLSGTPQALTSNKVTVSNLSFTRHYNLNNLSSPYGTDSVSYSFTMAANNTNQTQYYSQFFQSSAAVLAPVGQVALVQQAATSTSSAGITSIATTFGSANTAGNLLVAVVANNTSTASITLSDTESNVWTQALTVPYAAYNEELTVFYAANSESGANTVTAAFNKTVSHPALYVYEYRGANLNYPLDDSVSQLQPNNAAPSSGLANPTSTVELLFGATYNGNTLEVPSAATGFTMESSSTIAKFFAEDTDQYITGPVSADWQYTGSPSSSAALVTFGNINYIPPAWSGVTKLITAVANGVAAATNGFLYTIGGINSGGTVVSTTQYARINGNGSLGTQSTTVSLPAERTYDALGTLGNFIYVIGGSNNTGVGTSSIIYTSSTATGVLNAWNTANSLQAVLIQLAATSWNGYLYTSGGESTSFGCTAGVATTTVRYTSSTATGALNAWQTGTHLPAIVATQGMVATNGYLYSIGGCYTDESIGTTTVNFATINSDGSIGNWSSTSALPLTIRHPSVVAWNNVIYIVNGYGPGGGALGNVYYASVNSNGTLGSWQTASTPLPASIYQGSAVIYNGYIYSVAGFSGGGISTSTIFELPASTIQ